MAVLPITSSRRCRHCLLRNSHRCSSVSSRHVPQKVLLGDLHGYVLGDCRVYDAAPGSKRSTNASLLHWFEPSGPTLAPVGERFRLHGRGADDILLAAEQVDLEAQGADHDDVVCVVRCDHILRTGYRREHDRKRGSCISESWTAYL